MYDLSKLDKLVRPDVSKVVNDAIDATLPMYAGFYGDSLGDMGKISLCIYHYALIYKEIKSIDLEDDTWLYVYSNKIFPLPVNKKIPIEINAYAFACLGYMCGWNKHLVKFEDLDVNVLNELLPVGWANEMPIFVTQDTSGNTLPGREYVGFLEIGSYFVDRGQSIDQIFTKDNFRRYLLEYVNIMSYIVTPNPELRLLRYHTIAESRGILQEDFRNWLDGKSSPKSVRGYIISFLGAIRNKYISPYPDIPGQKEMVARLEGIEYLRYNSSFLEKDVYADFNIWMAACLIWGKIDINAPDDVIISAARVILKWEKECLFITGTNVFQDIFYINSIYPIQSEIRYTLGYTRYEKYNMRSSFHDKQFYKRVLPYINDFESNALILYYFVKIAEGSEEDAMPTVKDEIEKESDLYETVYCICLSIQHDVWRNQLFCHGCRRMS